jgi:hypothetical protein
MVAATECFYVSRYGGTIAPAPECLGHRADVKAPSVGLHAGRV